MRFNSGLYLQSQEGKQEEKMKSRSLDSVSSHKVDDVERHFAVEECSVWTAALAKYS